MPAKKKNCKALRTSECSTCRESQHKSQTEGDGHFAACYQMKLTIRADMASRGCQHPGCTETRPECLDGDHEDRIGKLCVQYRCTNYMYFAYKYAVATRMRRVSGSPGALPLVAIALCEVKTRGTVFKLFTESANILEK